MSFLSLQFLIFISVLLILYYTLFRKHQWILLLVASYVFYLMGGLSAFVFILSTTLSVYGCGRWMQSVKNRSESKKEARKTNKKILLAAVFLNFGILLLLKYYNFLAENINSMFAAFQFDASAPLVNILLPLGISFYTFQSIGYAIDVYRDKIDAEENLPRFALFISFFPQVIQGPISRYDNLGAALRQNHPFSYTQFKFGAQLFLWGCFKKMIIADRAGVVVSQVFGDYGNYDSLQTFVAIFLYAIQIYADFSGGIDMARGVAQTLGIDLIQNFQRPYFGNTVAEYWRRWHMSLTQWMRDYVFYPLTLSKMSAKIGKWGRKNLKGMIGKQLPSYLPTFVTFFLIGIWHGAGWGFITYGLYNATIIVLGMAFTPVFQSINKALHINDKAPLWKAWQILRTFLIMAAGKCITRAASVGAAFAMLGNCLHFSGLSHLVFRMTSMGLTGKNMGVLLIGMIVLFIVSVMQENGIKVREFISEKPLIIRWLIYFIAIAVILIFGMYGSGYDSGQFLYRNF